LLTIAALAALPAAALAEEAALEAAMRAVAGPDRVPGDGPGLTLRLPALAENGAQVPVTVAVDSR
jgi:predicted secreted protein